ncbi:MAG: hypothetical protein IPH16_20440 [Haliscomenobacter sp.]|nr:hypothetical protein [Haliscomenobacter sp.]
MFTLGQEWTLGNEGRWVTEVALSRLDRNRLSLVGQNDDWGWAAFTRFQKRFPLSDRPKGWQLSSNLSMETLHPDFQPINPYRNPEFLRDWSLADFLGQGTTAPAREFLARGEARLEHPQLGQAGYAFQAFLRGDIYRGEQHRLDWSLRPKNWEILGNLRLLDAQKEGETNLFFARIWKYAKCFPASEGGRCSCSPKENKMPDNNRRPTAFSMGASLSGIPRQGGKALKTNPGPCRFSPVSARTGSRNMAHGKRR